MKLISKFIVIILACGMLQACSGPGGMNKQGSGTLIGGATGALLGAQFGKGTGALFATGAGALIGGQIGAGMDEQDRKLAELSSQRALEAAPTGNTVEWRNPDNGHRGSITPTSTFKNDHGQYCREYTHTVVIGGQQQKAYGKACRKPDGQWEVVN